MKIRRYIDLTTDYGLKHIFGSEANKDLLLSFLNALFRGKKRFLDLMHNRNEHVGRTESTGNVIFDVTCTATGGEQFIIEVQRTLQANFIKRMLLYGCKHIADQAPQGKRKDWNYEITAVFVIAILDGFAMPDLPDGCGKRAVHPISLCNRETGEIFYEDFGFIYLELINFDKTADMLETDLDKWLYCLKHMATLTERPAVLNGPIFEKLFEVAEYSNFSKEEKAMFDRSLKEKWDAYSVKTTAENALKEAVEKGVRASEEALLKGREEGREEFIEFLITKMSFSDEQIVDTAKVSLELVQKVRARLSVST